MMAYLAYPIDQAIGARMVDVWDNVSMVKDLLADLNIVSYDPGDAFKIGPDTAVDGTINTINRCAQDQADITIAWLPGGVATVGVPMEIERAVQDGQDVIVVGGGSTGWAVGGQGGISRARQDTPQYQWWFAALKRVVASLKDRETVKSGEGGEVARPLKFTITAPDQTDWEGKTTAGWARLPSRAYPQDAGLDLYISRSTPVEPGEWIQLDTGLAVELPTGTWGLITGRSSSLDRGLWVKDSVIDEGYRGELKVTCWNNTQDRVEVARGDRIAQLVLQPNLTRLFDPALADALAPSDRDRLGYGSSGR